MTIQPLKLNGTGTHEMELGGGAQLISGDTQDLTFASLADAVKALVDTVQQDEHARLRMARITDAIDRQQLYREAGVETMKDFFPVLLQQTASVGWKSETSIKRYLGFYRLYIRQLNMDPRSAIRAVSHLHNLYKLAHLDRKSGELTDPDKAGKLDPVQFEDVVQLVTWLVAGPTKEQVLAGVPSEELSPVLEGLGLGKAAETYKELVGSDIALPQRGWTLGNTQAIIDAVTATGEEGEDEEDTKLVQFFVGYETHDKAVHVEKIEWRGADGSVVETIEVEKTYSSTMFKLLKGKAKAEIAGQDGEQNSEED